MQKKEVFLLGALIVLAGCATTGGRDYQSDIDMLNSRITVLQGEMASKDGEIARLQGQLAEQRASLAEADSQKRDLMMQLDEARRKQELQKTARARAADSDLK